MQVEQYRELYREAGPSQRLPQCLVIGRGFRRTPGDERKRVLGVDYLRRVASLHRHGEYVHMCINEIRYGRRHFRAPQGRDALEEEMKQIGLCDMAKLGTLDSSEKAIAVQGDR